jgi:hypothetical protein
MRKRPGRAGRRVLAAFALALLAAAPAGADEVRCAAVKSIGVARMAADGTLTLRLRTLPPGPIGEGTLTYKPGDAQYDAIKRHLGGIAPGETKPVPPWC